MNHQELRVLAEQYIDTQLKLANAKVTSDKRKELVERAVSMVRREPSRDAKTA